MTQLAPNTLAILDKLTDPLPRALAETRRALDDLLYLLTKLTTATVKDKDRLGDVEWLRWELEEAFEVLASELEKRS